MCRRTFHSASAASLAINLTVALVATLAGLAIFPALFTYGIKPTAGPPLIFVALPAAFDKMPGGRWVGLMFFVIDCCWRRLHRRGRHDRTGGRLELRKEVEDQARPRSAGLHHRRRLLRRGPAVLAVVLHPEGCASAVRREGVRDQDLLRHPRLRHRQHASAAECAAHPALFVGWCVKRATAGRGVVAQGAGRARLADFGDDFVAGSGGGPHLVSLIFPETAKALLGQLLHHA